MKMIKKQLGQSLIFGIVMTLFQNLQQRDELFSYFVGITLTYFVCLVFFSWIIDKVKKKKD